MNYDMKQAGDRIYQLRTHHGYTQELLATKLNIDRSFYSRIEAGKNGCSVDLFVQLSGLFEVSLDYLVLGKCNTDSFKDKEKLLLKEDIEKLINHLEQIKTIF